MAGLKIVLGCTALLLVLALCSVSAEDAKLTEAESGFNELDSSVLSDAVANTEKLGDTVQSTQLWRRSRRRRRRRFRRWRGRIRRRRRRARRAPCRVGKGVRLGKCGGRSNADIVVLQDASGSVNSLEWSQQQCFTKGLINSLPLGSTGGRMGIATFAYRSKTVCSMTSSKSKLLRSPYASRSGVGRSTWTARGLRESSKIFKRAGGKRNKILVVLTDGYPNQPRRGAEGHTARMYKLIRGEKITIIVVLIGRNFRYGWVKRWSPHRIQVKSFNAMAKVMRKVSRKTCTAAKRRARRTPARRVRLYKSPGRRRRKANVRRRRRARRSSRRRRKRRSSRRRRSRRRRSRRRRRRPPAKCRIGGGKRLSQCRGKIKTDIVVLQDASGSVNSREWSQSICFTKGLINTLPMGSSGGRIGIATFAYRSRTILPMTGSRSKALRSPYKSRAYVGRSTWTARGLRESLKILKKGGGKRAKLLVVLTDGYPNQPRNRRTAAHHTLSMYKRIKREKITVIIVLIGRNFNWGDVRRWRGIQVKVGSYGRMANVLTKVGKLTCKTAKKVSRRRSFKIRRVKTFRSPGRRRRKAIVSRRRRKAIVSRRRRAAKRRSSRRRRSRRSKGQRVQGKEQQVQRRGKYRRHRGRQGAGRGNPKGCKVTKAWANSHLKWCSWSGWTSWRRG
jgi:hypothetical protein